MIKSGRFTYNSRRQHVSFGLALMFVSISSKNKRSKQFGMFSRSIYRQTGFDRSQILFSNQASGLDHLVFSWVSAASDLVSTTSVLSGSVPRASFMQAWTSPMISSMFGGPKCLTKSTRSALPPPEAPKERRKDLGPGRKEKEILEHHGEPPIQSGIPQEDGGAAAIGNEPRGRPRSPERS